MSSSMSRSVCPGIVLNKGHHIVLFIITQHSYFESSFSKVSVTEELTTALIEDKETTVPGNVSYINERCIEC